MPMIIQQADNNTNGCNVRADPKLILESIRKGLSNCALLQGSQGRNLIQCLS